MKEGEKSLFPDHNSIKLIKNDIFPIRFSAKNIKEYVRNGLILLSQNNQNISLTDIRLSVTLCIINLKQVDSFLITKFSGIMKVQRNLYK